MFVYGTLRRGQRNHCCLQNARALGKCKTAPAFTLIDAGGFPGAIEPGNQAIVGEVYEIDSDTLRRLDELEGYPNFFTRSVIGTEYGPCWIYLYRQANGVENIVPSGDWLQPAGS